MLEPAPIVGISKTAYVLATPRGLEARGDLSQASTNNDPSHSDSQAPCRRPARRGRGDRREPRLPVPVVLVLDGGIPRRSAARHGVAGLRPGRGPERAV